LQKLAVAIERDLARTTVPSPTEEARYARHRLTINTGTAVTKFHDERDILRRPSHPCNEHRHAEPS
jgi:hypothetical protein